MQRFSAMDHFVVCGALFATAVDNLSVFHEIDNTSDHDPIGLNFGIKIALLAGSPRQFVSKPA